MSLDTEAIRRNTSLALPADDAYLFRLGVALYGFASVNSFMTEIITHLDPQADRSQLHGLMSGRVLDTFRATVKAWNGADINDPAKRAATAFERLNTERSDFVHAYPITNPVGEQILHRRVDDKKKYFEVTDDFLDDFTGRLRSVSEALHEIRDIVRPRV
ncbi:hypothetical protein [Brevibacterium sp. FME37]|uniref:hypothetical protein n=1 Tax=Brevibacterium sp. FME37 TaxID=2742607 RepID=UPI001867E328|nr:hypothetical protein [Brevibacterium sp. FME37]